MTTEHLNAQQFADIHANHETQYSWRHYGHKYTCATHGGYGSSQSRPDALKAMVASCDRKSGTIRE